jgi:hypothetical protein
LASFYFIGSVGFELPFSTFSFASCYKGKGINDRKGFSCGCRVIIVKVSDLIYGKKMTVCLISSWH